MDMILSNASLDARNILVIVNSLSELDSAWLIFRENPDYVFCAVIPGEFCFQDFCNSRLSELPNLILNCSQNDVLYKIRNTGLVLAVGCGASGILPDFLRLISFCSELHIPVAELQCSILRLGASDFTKPESYAETKTLKTDHDFINAGGFADYLLSYYPATAERCNGTVIGFTKYHQKELNCSFCNAGYVLVLADFSVGCFTAEDTDAFLGCIIKTAASYPDIQFLIRPDDSGIEFYFNKTISFNACENITIVQFDPLLGLIPFDSLIADSAKVVSTLSSSLLECEALGKDTIVYKCKSCSGLLDEIDECRTFSNADELRPFVEGREHCAVRTGKLIEFDNSVFRDFVERTFSVPDLPKQQILKQIVRYSALLDSDRWKIEISGIGD